MTCLSVFCGTCDNCTTGRTVLCTDTTVKMLPGQSNRLSWARSEKLNQFLNLSSFAEQMLVHENAIVKIRKDMLMPAPIEAARPTRNVCQFWWVAKAAANSGASVETEPSIRPARPGCTYCSTNIRR